MSETRGQERGRKLSRYILLLRDFFSEYVSISFDITLLNL